MSLHPFKTSSFLFLAALVGCSSGETETTSGAGIQIAPSDRSECATDDCGDYPDDGECSGWSQSGDGEGCMLECPRGGPTGPIAWRFECYEVHVVSCKDLSNVVVEYADGDVYKYDGLKGHHGTFGAGEKEIVGAWVKAGNNGSGDCPGCGVRIEPDGSECDDGGAGGAGGDGGAGGMGGAGGYGGEGGMGGDDGSDDCKPELECRQGGKYGKIEVEFECHEAHIASCKDLSNVVLEFADGEHRKFEPIDGRCATLGVGERELVGAWVKAGDNASGDGPGYGERFDSPPDTCEGAGGAGGAGGDGGTGGAAGEGGAGGAGGEPGYGGFGGGIIVH
jgi:hypothetical protein